jgi:hypothetical protein
MVIYSLWLESEFKGDCRLSLCRMATKSNGPRVTGIQVLGFLPIEISMT